jgi:hypothetical protein
MSYHNNFQCPPCAYFYVGTKKAYCVTVLHKSTNWSMIHPKVFIAEQNDISLWPWFSGVSLLISAVYAQLRMTLDQVWHSRSYDITTFEATNIPHLRQRHYHTQKKTLIHSVFQGLFQWKRINSKQHLTWLKASAFLSKFFCWVSRNTTTYTWDW